MNTRFAPTITYGDLHVGHYLNLLANLYQAKKTGGKMTVVLDNTQLILPSAAGVPKFQEFIGYIKANTDVLKLILKDYSPCLLLGDNLPTIHALLEHRLGKEEVERLPIYSDHFYLMAFDYLIGVDAIIRGADWHNETFKDMSIFALEQMHQKEVFAAVHPLMTEGGEKIGKSRMQEKVSLKYLIKQLCVHPLSIVLYVTNMMNGEPVGPESILEYHQQFSIESACDKTYEYRESDLLELDKLTVAGNSREFLDMIYQNLMRS